MKKIFIGLLCMLMVFSMLVGCSNNNENNSKNESSEIKDNNNVKDNNDSSEEVAEVVEISVFGYKTGNEEGAIPELVANFNEEYKNINVTYEGISNAGGYEDILKTRLASGQGDDVFFSNSNYLGELVDAGYTKDLRDMEVVSTYSDVVKSLQEVGDQIPAIVMEVAVFGMFVNTDLLNEVGISEVPKNYKEFLVACEALKQADYTPIVTGAKDGTGTALFAMPKALGPLYLNGEITSAINELNTGDKLVGEVAKPGFELVSELVEKGYIDGPKALISSLGQDAVAEFSKGKAGFMPGGSWLVAGIDKASDGFNYVLTGIPVLEDESVVMINPATKLCINSASDNIEEAQTFLEYFSSVENVNKYVFSQNSFNPIVGGLSADNEKVKMASEIIGKQRIMPWNDTNFDTRVINGWSDFKKFSSFIAGGATVEKTVSDMNAQIKNNLELVKD